ncbi:obscurin-like protein 1 [Culicoides brevitarsis]|uniref:obscurin-like protein 1 n=1 Tax=Culicoides brevitarsis TaxID=469753 RepID=UPI00307B35E4
MRTYYSLLSLFLLFLTSNGIARGFLLPLYDGGVNSTNVFFDLGSTVSLSCRVTEKFESATNIVWAKHSETTNETHYIKDGIKTSADMSTLVIQNARNKDAGNYSCECNDETYTFRVISRLRVKIRPSKEVICAIEGEMLLLKCVGVGTKVHLRWLFNGHINDIKFIRRFGPNFESNTLVIKKTEKSHSGLYTCEARYNDSMELEEVVAKSLTVRVRDHYVGMFNVVYWPKTCAVFFLSDKELHNF